MLTFGFTQEMKASLLGESIDQYIETNRQPS